MSAHNQLSTTLCFLSRSFGKISLIFVSSLCIMPPMLGLCMNHEKTLWKLVNFVAITLFPNVKLTWGQIYILYKGWLCWLLNNNLSSPNSPRCVASSQHFYNGQWKKTKSTSNSQRKGKHQPGLNYPKSCHDTAACECITNILRIVLKLGHKLNQNNSLIGFNSIYMVYVHYLAVGCILGRTSSNSRPEQDTKNLDS